MDRLERLAIAWSFALFSVFLSTNGGHTTVQNGLSDEKTQKRASPHIIT